jgi:hypothetical protein
VLRAECLGQLGHRLARRDFGSEMFTATLVDTGHQQQ